VETDFRTRSVGPRALGAGERAEGRYADVGRLLITRPDRPRIVAAVSSFLSSSGANIAGSQRHSTDPFGGTFFLKIGFQPDVLGEFFTNLAVTFGKLAGKFSMRWKMTRAGELKRAAAMVSKAGQVRG
jgi:formyltetrahydrofolate deformylase